MCECMLGVYVGKYTSLTEPGRAKLVVVTATAAGGVYDGFGLLNVCICVCVSVFVCVVTII